jgi:hypothetical protein
MTSRRTFLGGALVGAAAVTRAGAATLPEAPTHSSAATMAPLAPPNGRPYNPVVTLNGWTLPWRMKDGVKEFHLVAEPVVREIAPGMKANLWGYNGQSQVRRSKWWRATACAFLSPTSCPNTPASTGMARSCPTAWTASPA